MVFLPFSVRIAEQRRLYKSTAGSAAANSLRLLELFSLNFIVQLLGQFLFAYKPGFHEARAFALLAAPGQNDDLPLICLAFPGKQGVRLVCKRRQGTRSRFDLETASSLQVLRPAGFTACFCYVLRKFHQIKIYEIAALW